MAEGTTELFLKPRDGWVAAVTGPEQHVLLHAPRNAFAVYVGASPPSASDTPASANLSYTGRPTAGTKASAVLTFEDDADTGDPVIEDDTVEIGSVTYTFKAVPAAEFDVLLGADNLESAANLVDVVQNGNALTDPNPEFEAAAVALVVTFTALLNGTALNAADSIATSGGMAFGAATPVDGVAGQTLTLAGTVYTFVTTLSKPARVAGGSANEVLIGADADGDYTNLEAAVNGTGTAGTTYGTGTTHHPSNVRAVLVAGSDDLGFFGGPGDNGIAISETLSNATLDGSATALAGGAPAPKGIQLGNLTMDFDATFRIDDLQGNVYVRALEQGARNFEVEPVKLVVMVTGAPAP